MEESKPVQAASLAGEQRATARPGAAGQALLGGGVDDDAGADLSPAAACSPPPARPACVRGCRCGAFGSGSGSAGSER